MDEGIRWGIYDSVTKKRWGIWEFESEEQAERWLRHQRDTGFNVLYFYVSPIMDGEA